MISTRMVAAILWFAGIAIGQAPPRRIIDVHMHAYQDDARWGRAGKDALTGQPINAAAGPDAQRSETLSAMKQLNIVKAVVSGDHEAVLRWRQDAPEKILVGYQIVDPSKVDVAFLRQEHAAGRLDVLAEVEPQYEGIRPDDPRLEPIFAMAEELDIRVGLHMHPSYPGAAYRGAPRMRASNGDPLLLEDVLVRHPRLRLYIMHAGWPFLERTIALMYAHPQVYVDIGVITWTTPPSEFRRFLKGLVDAGYGKRIMFGSDQMVWPARIAQAVSAVEDADFLSVAQKDDIFYNNAVSFFRFTKARP